MQWKSNEEKKNLMTVRISRGWAFSSIFLIFFTHIQVQCSKLVRMQSDGIFNGESDSVRMLWLPWLVKIRTQVYDTCMNL